MAVKNRNQTATDPASQLWRSTGWDKATADATSWALVLSSSGGGTIFDGRWSLTPRAVAPAWSVSAGRIVVNEYGAHTKSSESTTPAQAAIRAWMSTDDGATWTQIFDLRDQYPGLTYANINFHIHAIAYDPWDDRVFITTGDGGNGDGGYCAVFYCDAEKLPTAPTWVPVPSMRSTSALAQVIAIIPTPTGVLFSPDSGSLGVWRLPRRGYRRYGTASAVAQIGSGIVGSHIHQNPDPGSPMFFTYNSSAQSGPPAVLASLDGATITEVYRDGTAVSNSAPGINCVCGPDLGGKVYGNRNIDGTGKLVTWDYQPQQVAGGAVANVPTNRQVATGAGMSGGGDLSTDRTLTVISDATPTRNGGYAAHTYPAHLGASTSPTLTGGILYLMKVVAVDARASAARKVAFFQTSAASGLTLAKTAVFDASGTQIGVSADISGTLNGSANTTRQVDTGTFAIAKGSEFYVALLCVGTTGPIVTRSSNSGVANAGLSGASLLWAKTTDAGLTDMPASITPSTLTSQPIALWFGLA